MTKKPVLYVSSQSHSGSTLLDLVLGGHPRFIGLGEIAQVIERVPMADADTRRIMCSCGQAMRDCKFWSVVLSRLPNDRAVALEEGYSVIIEAFHEVFGDDYVPVDSSKYLRYLRPLHATGLYDMQVLHLIRDVRAFTISQIENRKRYNRRSGWPLAYVFFLNWYRENRGMRQYLADEDVRSRQVGYEELCLYPQFMARQICEFLNVPEAQEMLDLSASGSHSVLGNRMRTQKEKRVIRYDHRWFLRREWQTPALLFRHIMAFNAANVYSNRTEIIWER